MIKDLLITPVANAGDQLRRAGALRLGLGGFGLVVMLYAALSIMRDTNATNPKHLLIWLIGAVIVHDAILAPLTVAVGWLVARVVPRRERPFVQAFLGVSALATIIALPLIHREGKSDPGSTLERQNYTGNLALIIAAVAVVCVAAYATRRIRERPLTTSSTNERRPDDQD